MRFARRPVHENRRECSARAASRADRISVASLSFTQKLKNSRSKTFAFSARSGAQQPRQAHETSSAPARFWVVRTTRVRVRARGVAIPDVWRTRRQPRSRGVCQKRVAWVWSAKNFRRPAPGGDAPGSSSCLHLRASPPRRWRSRRGPSSSGPSQRFGEARAGRACAVPAVVIVGDDPNSPKRRLRVAFNKRAAGPRDELRTLKAENLNCVPFRSRERQNLNIP